MCKKQQIILSKLFLPVDTCLEITSKNVPKMSPTLLKYTYKCPKTPALRTIILKCPIKFPKWPKNVPKTHNNVSKLPLF